MLREGVPCAPVPAVAFFPVSQSVVDRDRPRLERAFAKYVAARAPSASADEGGADEGAGGAASAAAGKASAGTAAGAQRVEERSASTGSASAPLEMDIIVAHGNIIRFWVCKALGLPAASWLRFSVYNCSLTWLEVHHDGAMTLRMLGDVGHLPVQMATSN